MKETIDTIIKWHKQVFPDATLSGQLTKYAEETNELKNRKRVWNKTDNVNYHHENGVED